MSWEIIETLMEGKAAAAIEPWAEMAGKPYRPSSGTEGIAFDNHWCDHPSCHDLMILTTYGQFPMSTHTSTHTSIRADVRQAWKGLYRLGKRRPGLQSACQILASNILRLSVQPDDWRLRRIVVWQIVLLDDAVTIQVCGPELTH